MTNGPTPPRPNPIPPEDAGATAAGGGGAGEDRGVNRAILVAAALLLLAGVAVGAYFVGREAADADAAEKRGVRKGRAAVQRQYARGAPAYKRIYDDGFRAGRAEGQRLGQRQGERQGAERGRRAGLERGREIGELQGEREGIESGATAALGGLTDWATGSWYLVKMATGEQGVPFRVQSRKQVADDERYAICADNPADICTEPIPGG